ncbi:MAG: PEGA domain-containing protein [Terriglobia bacterium]
MISVLRKGHLLLGLALSAFLLASGLFAEKNQVMGEVKFEARSGVEKTAGVWVDGQYVGYLKELKGSKKVLLLPGQHMISVREDGYQEITRPVSIQPGVTQTISVGLVKVATPPMPLVKSTVKLNVSPSRAAVFVDGLYVGHVKEFEGLGRGMLVAPGDHQISIALPGYQEFETNIKPLPNQKVEIKTELVKSSGPPTGPLVNKETGEAAPPAGGPDASAAQSH